MRRLLPFRKPKLKPSTGTGNTLLEGTWIALGALRDSADAFPPLKSAVGGVVALWEIAKRAKHSKTDARDIALRTKEILDLIADAVPDGSDIPPPMLRHSAPYWRVSILDEIRCSMEAISLSGKASRLVHLGDNERIIQDIKARLDDQYRDFLAASVLRVELQQTTIAVRQAQQQTQIQSDIKQVSAVTDILAQDLAGLLFYSRFVVFLASP
ncbi:hypothetical protein C8J57DRAFT_1261017 [Mycena rebaudengoi]|nr:hypothetical protein C8J57DRAFT_1261017 [Mycena rebaudengoi]